MVGALLPGDQELTMRREGFQEGVASWSLWGLGLWWA